MNSGGTSHESNDRKGNQSWQQDHRQQSNLTQRDCRTRVRLALTVCRLLLTLLLAALNQTIVGTALPSIVADLGGFDHYTWATTAYLVTSTVAVPIAGKLSAQDRRVDPLAGM
jgi:hypothetical protein